MTIHHSRSMSLALLLVSFGISSARAEAPAGWHIAGSTPADYEFSQTDTASSGKHGSVIAAKSAAASGFGTLMQTIDADNYRGARWRLSGYMKTEEVAKAQMWMRVDGPQGKVLAFDNMDSRYVAGTTQWKRYEIVLDVPSNSADIAFGYFLAGRGKVWADNFKLEKVDATVPLTATSTDSGMPKAPANPDFER
ncbi:MAG: hypothetical protein ABI616_05660 [Pseudomonadota bacterium]